MRSLLATDAQLESTDAHLNRFREYLFEQGLQPATIASYVTDVRQFHAFLTHMGERHPLPPTRWHVTRFRSYLLDQRLKIATFNKKINSLAAHERFLKRPVLPTAEKSPASDAKTVSPTARRFPYPSVRTWLAPDRYASPLT